MLEEYFNKINKDNSIINRCKKTQIFVEKKIGFGYNTQKEIINDLKDELNELYAELKENNTERIKEEIGDVLFVLCNLSNIYKIDLEEALKESNGEYQERLMYIENKIKDGEANKNTIKKLWKEAKNRNKK
jgi:uncharacterized protein YabN with tetrapyrrole methylase and pyrophosphatase domain